MKNLLKKSFATLGLLSFIALLPISCGVVCNDVCGCGPQFEVQNFKILSFETLPLTKAGQRVNPTTPLPYSEIFKSFRILDVQTISLNEPKNSFSLPGVGYACSPVSPKSVDLMRGIQVLNSKEVTLGDGTLLKVGDDITKYFGINGFFSEKITPSETFFKAPIEVYRDDLFKLGWKQNPQKELILEFSLRIFFTNGREFNLNNEVLAIRQP
jgi:hypothetical protein